MITTGAASVVVAGGANAAPSEAAAAPTTSTTAAPAVTAAPTTVAAAPTTVAPALGVAPPATASAVTEAPTTLPPPTTVPPATTTAVAPPAPVTYTIDGPVAGTRWGPVQVQITVQDGVLVEVVALQTPFEHRKSIGINEWAVPALREASAHRPERQHRRGQRRDGDLGRLHRVAAGRARRRSPLTAFVTGSGSGRAAAGHGGSGGYPRRLARPGAGGGGLRLVPLGRGDLLGLRGRQRSNPSGPARAVRRRRPPAGARGAPPMRGADPAHRRRLPASARVTSTARST